MKDIQGFEGEYAITEDGKVWSYKTNKWMRLRSSGFSRGSNKRKYKTINLFKRKEGCKYFYVHRLVAQAFIPNPKKLPNINHLNADGSDNRVQNLEWCTQAQNSLHTKLMGRTTRGEKDTRAILNEEQVKQIREIYGQGGTSHVKLGKKYGVSKSTIYLILKRVNWAHI